MVRNLTLSSLLASQSQTDSCLTCRKVATSSPSTLQSSSSRDRASIFIDSGLDHVASPEPITEARGQECSDWPDLGYGLTPGVEGSEFYGLRIVRERVSSLQKN